MPVERRGAMSLTEQQLESYRTQGFLRVEGVFSNDETDRLRRLVYRLYRKFQPDDGELDGVDAAWDDVRFDRKMIELRARNPRAFGALYDCAQNSIDVLRFVTDPGVREIAAQCLGDASENLACSGIMYRMDPPKDDRNAIGWHQDRAYYPQNEDGNQGLVATIALQDIVADTGALVICPDSQRAGFVAPHTAGKADYESTEQKTVPAEQVDRYDQVHNEMKRGDVTVMNMNLFHRSGVNLGERIRYTALCRFHRILADDYVPFGLLYQFNDFLSGRIRKSRNEG